MNKLEFKYKIKITGEAFYKLEKYTEEAKNEIGGIFEIETENDTATIVDTLLFEQTASGGDFELDKEKLSEYCKKILEENPEKLSKLRGWWHKHPISGWSSTDNNTFERLGKCFNGEIIGTVFQEPIKKFLWRIDLNQSDNKLSFETNNVEVINKLTEKEKREMLVLIKKEVADKVKERKIDLTQYTNGKNPNIFYYDGEAYRYTVESLFSQIDSAIQKVISYSTKKEREMCQEEIGCSECRFKVFCTEKGKINIWVGGMYD